MQSMFGKKKKKLHVLTQSTFAFLCISPSLERVHTLWTRQVIQHPPFLKIQPLNVLLQRTGLYTTPENIQTRMFIRTFQTKQGSNHSLHNNNSNSLWMHHFYYLRINLQHFHIKVVGSTFSKMKNSLKF